MGGAEVKNADAVPIGCNCVVMELLVATTWGPEDDPGRWCWVPACLVRCGASDPHRK
jgi:hypothetical protein